MRKLTSVLILLMAMTFIAGCSSIDCSLNSLVRSYYAFRNPDGTADTLHDTLTITTHTVHGDTILLNRATEITEFSLPVSYSLDGDTLNFRFRLKDGREFEDVVVIRKTNISHFESVDCPPTFFHDIDSISYSVKAIDSLKVNEKHIDNGTEKKNIYIYLKSDI